MLYVKDQIGRFTWKATDENQKTYAVRQIKQERIAFFSHLMALKLDFVPRIYYVGHDSGQNYCAIERFVQGVTLRQMQSEFTGQYEKVASLLVQLRSCLCRLWSHNIVHGDIKPENIMVSDRVYLVDFEFGQKSDVDGKAPCLGYTPLYCSLDQLHGVVSREADMRALGITMLELFCGNHPFYNGGSGSPEETARIVAESEIENTPGGIFDLIADMCRANPIGTLHISS